MSEQTLEMQIHTKSQQAVQSLNKLVNGLNKVENKVNGVNKSVNKVSTSKANKEMNNLNNSINKAANSMLKLKSLFTFSGVKKLTQTGLSWMNEAIDYTEQLNLFNVVFKNIEKNGTTMYSSLGKEATKFQYRMNEAFGTNKTQTLYMQGIFQSMGENVGIGSKYAGIMSESMTKLTYDLASLYNKNEKDTAEAIRAGVYAGQTKPLRSYGIDVTQTSLQPILDSLGIADRSVKQMSQAEKEILRYIATMNQAKVAMGDLANTIEYPSNQLKVFRQQLAEAKVSLSSLFIGGLASVLPYVNAFLMVVKEVAKAIASMFGIKLKDYNTSIADSGDAYIDLSDDIDGATDSVKELKRQSLGFDEIHNINEDTGSGSSGGSVSGGIDQRLLDSINGYDNGMSNIKMKASQIRDDIMKWLGFTKEIDPITGEVSFKYEGIKTTLKNMWNSFKGLSTEGKILVSLGLVTGAIKLWNAGKNLVSVFGSSGLFKIISNLAKSFKNLIEYTRVYTSITGNLNDGIVGGIDAWRKQNGIIAETTGKFTGWTSVVNGGKIALKGLITAGLGLYTVSEATKNLSTEGANLANVIGLVGGGLTTIASGVQIGSIFGPLGSLIGGAISSLSVLINVVTNYKTEIDKVAEKTQNVTDKTNNYINSIKNQYNAIQESVKDELTIHEYNKKLLNELNLIVDANGKIKIGYEDRAEFIITELNNAYGTEYKIVDGIIQQYDGLNKKIGELIKQREIEIMLEGKKQQYINAIKNQYKDYLQYEEQLKAVEDAEASLLIAQDKVNEARQRRDKSWNDGAYIVESINLKKAEDSLKKLTDSYDNAKIKLDEYKNTVALNGLIISDYSSLTSASVSGDLDLINSAIENSTTTWIENGEMKKVSLAEQMRYLDYQYNIVGAGITKEYYEGEKKGLIDSLVSMSNSTREMTPEIVEAWATLGKQNKDEFLENFKKLPEGIQTDIISQMYKNGYTISEELQKGINGITPTIKISADTNDANYKIDTFLNGLKSKPGIIGLAGSLVGGILKLNEKGGIYSNGSWKNISQYANGGIPSHGSVFVAGEHGAEIVGHINGKTEVLNQSQIASSIYSAVVDAMSQFNVTGVAEINVHADEGIIVETAINGINRKTNQAGICPLKIPIN